MEVHTFKKQPNFQIRENDILPWFLKLSPRWRVCETATYPAAILSGIFTFAPVVNSHVQ